MKKKLVLLVLVAMLVPPQPPVSQATIVQTSATSDPAMATLYPEDLDPPGSCGMPLRGPFGQDVEILVAPGDGNPMYQLYLDPNWYDQQLLPGTTPISNISAIAQGSEQIVATWTGSGGNLFYDSWSVSNGWSSAQSLNQTSDSTPALLSRNAYNWVIFARVGGGIKFREWNYGTLGEWLDVAGVEGTASAASDPVVISKDPNHMAVFYRDESGTVWFTEGIIGGGATSLQSIQASTQMTSTIWRSQPVSLSGVESFYEIYLPLVAKNSLGASLVSGSAASSEPDISSLEASTVFTLTSDLSVASRNENHLAVFGVDVNHQLWVKEWTNHNASDWSDTAWVKLMDNVMVERPAVTSRHSNHLGVAVRDTSGVPWYIEWTYAASWKTPVSLSGTRSNPLTIAAPRIDAMTVFSVEGGRIVHKEWDETEGWGHWQEFADTNAKNDQILADATRQMDDLMLLGRRSDGAGFYKHFTSLGQELRESVAAPGAAVSAHRGDQTLAWVDGKTLWVGADQNQTITDTWKIEALALTDGVTASLALPTHSWGGWADGKSAMAAGDVDFDGDDEIVIATATNATPTFSISVLNLAVSPTLAITLTSTVTRNHSTAAGPSDGRRLDVAIGDLDGDGRQDEVAVTYHLEAATDDFYQPFVGLFEYITPTNTLKYQGYKNLTYYGAGAGAWNLTGSMNTGRHFHTATLLPDGRVLVAGGDSLGGTLASAEVYDPVTGYWSTANPMSTARWLHTATPLPDGRVLVAGGYAGVVNLASAEVYNPATGTWSVTGSMNVARAGHTATLLPNGRVLVAGAGSSEVYDPAAGTWSTTGSMNVGRGGHTATLLPDGHVLVAGSSWGGFSASAEVYDPVAGVWNTTGSMNTARADHTATLLPDGRVLVAGGYNYSSRLASAEVYDPGTGTWSSTGSMTTARSDHTATLLPGGRLLVAGGYGGGILASAEAYDPANSTWSVAGSLNTARDVHTATLLRNGRILVTGGGGAVVAYLASAEVYEGLTSQDVRTTIGKVINRHPSYGRIPGEQLVVATSYDFGNSAGYRYIHTEVYSMTFTSPDWSFVKLDAVDEPGYAYSSQPWINFTTDDLDADFLEEIVYARSGALHVIDYDRQSGMQQEISFAPGYPNRVNDAKIINVVGDVDLDGKAEIAYWTEDNRVAILDLVDENTLHLSGSIAPSVSYGDLLIGDLDDDSFRSDLVGCTNFSEVSVIAVLNGAPRVYASGLPVQDTDVRYAKTATGGSSSAWGTTTNLGGFTSVGFEIEINVPLIGIKLGEVRGSVTQDFMASQGQTRAVEESVTLSSGYNNADGQTLGIVVYNGTDYKCYYYDLYSPAAPTQKSRAMICRPIGNAYENFYSLEQWHSASFKQQAGSSWVDVGHRTAADVRTNDVNTYPPGLPVDPYLLKYTWPPATPFRVDYDVSGGYTDWSITQMQGTSQESSRSFETNTTVSAGATAGVVTVDAGVTVGRGWEQSRSVSWSNELEIGGAVYKISNPAFQTCVYTAVPYIYHAKATSLAGVTYPYLEMDYYVPTMDGNCGTLSRLDDAAHSAGTWQTARSRLHRLSN